MELLGAMPFSQGLSSVSTGDSMVMMYRCVCGHVRACVHVCVCVCGLYSSMNSHTES